MGSLWEPYGKGVPFLGAPGNSLDYTRNSGLCFQRSKQVSVAATAKITTGHLWHLRVFIGPNLGAQEIVMD